MARTRFQKYLLLPLNFIIVWSLSNAAIAVQNVPGGTSAIATGDFVTFTAQPPESVLNVPSGVNLSTVNAGFSVQNLSTDAFGVINFAGNSVVSGAIGAPGATVRVINMGVLGTSVTFNGNVSAALQFNGNNSTAILGPGVIYTGAATTTTANTGMLVLNGGSNYVGAIGNGTFFLNQISLNGNAAITGAIASQSIVLGANTLAQTGAVTFPANAQITVRALSDTVFGSINAAGSAINFTTGLQVNMLVDNTIILSGVPLQVVTGTSGSFGPGSAPITVTSNNVRFTFTGLNPAGTGNVLIFPTVVPPILPPGSPAVAVASAFDAAVFGASGDLALVQRLVTRLNNLQAIGEAVAQFAPTVNGGNVAMSFEALSQFQGLWQSNLAKARAANMCFRCESACGASSCLSPCSCDPCNKPSNELAWNGEGVWVDGFGDSIRQGTRLMIPGYNATMYGGMIGVQRPVSQNWQLGIGGGYAYTNIRGKGVQKNGTKIDTPQGTVYAGYTCGPAYLDNFFTYAWNHYKGFRHIAFTGLDRTARASYNGQEYGLLSSAGYNFFTPIGFTVTPLASMQFTWLRIGSYTEKDAISLNLVQQAQKYNIVQSGVGLMVGYPAQVNCGTLFTEVHSRWLHNLKNYRIVNNSRFAGGGPEFQTRGVTPSHNILNAGVSTTLFTAGNFALKASYEYNYQRTYVFHEGRATVAYKF